MWSIGCFAVEMLVGGNPWGMRHQDLFGLQKALREGETPVLAGELKISEACRNFIGRCLKHKYKDRPYIEDLKQDPWINNNN